MTEISEYMKRSTNRSNVEMGEKWHEIMKQIPFIPFKQDWMVQVIPPFAGAVVRFCVKKKEDGRVVSIYLDWYSTLGCVNQPYWEIYPNEDNDTSRFYLNEIEELINAIEISLNHE